VSRVPVMLVTEAARLAGRMPDPLDAALLDAWEAA
jgi:hypothetical protein